MRTKIGVIIVSALLIIAGVNWLLVGSRALASSDNNNAAIGELEQRLADAYNKRDVDAVMAFYVDRKDAVFFEDTVPFQVKGTSALRKANSDFYEYQNVTQWHARVEALSVVISGDLAAAHFIVPITWTDKRGTHFQRSRCTHVLERINGRWLIWHEHFSVPFDPATGKAVLNARQ